MQYLSEVLKEHLWTRSGAGLFDAFHMDQIALRLKSGTIADVAKALERLVLQNILAPAFGRQRYAQFTSRDGGIVDDLRGVHFGGHLFPAVNAACEVSQYQSADD